MGLLGDYSLANRFVPSKESLDKKKKKKKKKKKIDIYKSHAFSLSAKQTKSNNSITLKSSKCHKYIYFFASSLLNKYLKCLFKLDSNYMH